MIEKKCNPPDSSTYNVGEMNIRHSLVSGTAECFCCFDQDKYSCQNIDHNKHTEKRGVTDDSDYDDYDVVS